MKLRKMTVYKLVLEMSIKIERVLYCVVICFLAAASAFCVVENSKLHEEIAVQADELRAANEELHIANEKCEEAEEALQALRDSKTNSKYEELMARSRAIAAGESIASATQSTSQPASETNSTYEELMAKARAIGEGESIASAPSTSGSKTQELTGSEANIARAAKCGYIAGYYAHKMGFDCPVNNDYFYNFHAFVEEWLPQENLKEITIDIIDR